MSDIYKGELQDNEGNTIYPHTEADVTFCADGETVQEKLNKTENALGNTSGTSGSLEVSNPNILATTEATHALIGIFGGITEFVLDEATGKITGYKTKIGGADTVFPFSSEMIKGTVSALRGEVNLGFSPRQVVFIGSYKSSGGTVGFTPICMRGEMECNYLIRNNATSSPTMVLTITENGFTYDFEQGSSAYINASGQYLAIA